MAVYGQQIRPKIITLIIDPPSSPKSTRTGAPSLRREWLVGREASCSRCSAGGSLSIHSALVLIGFCEPSGTHQICPTELQRAIREVDEHVRTCSKSQCLHRLRLSDKAGRSLTLENLAWVLRGLVTSQRLEIGVSTHLNRIVDDIAVLADWGEDSTNVAARRRTWKSIYEYTFPHRAA